MNGLARKLVTSELKKIKWQRKLSVSASLRKDEDFIIKSFLPEKKIPDMKLLDRVWIESAGFKKLVALECAETKKMYTYEQLQHKTGIFATSLLKKFGLKQGDIVAIMLPNCPEFVVAALGVVQAGCTMTTINPIYKELELTHQLSLTRPKLIVTTSKCYDTIVKSMKNAKLDMRIIVKDSVETPVPDGTVRFSEVAEAGEVDNALLDKVEKRKPDDIAIIPFSSGTTGLPKGVEITHRNVIAAMEIMNEERNCYPMLANEQLKFLQAIPDHSSYYPILKSSPSFEMCPSGNEPDIISARISVTEETENDDETLIYIDVNSELSYISEEYCIELNTMYPNLLKVPVQPFRVISVAGRISENISLMALLPVQFEDVIIEMFFFIVSELTVSMIIGVDYIRASALAARLRRDNGGFLLNHEGAYTWIRLQSSDSYRCQS